MEAVYAKLYDKYTKLKANKFEEMDEVSKAQEEKFLNYVTEELMDFMKKENDELRIQNIELRTQQLESPRSTIGSTGAGAFEESPAQNLYQFLVECLLGMKVSITKKEELVISALHESSGYSISMKTVNFGGREESELLCRVVSLGTLEQATTPDCMREDIIVSKAMIPIFFGRVSSVINKH